MCKGVWGCWELNCLVEVRAQFSEEQFPQRMVSKRDSFQNTLAEKNNIKNTNKKFSPINNYTPIETLPT